MKSLSTIFQPSNLEPKKKKREESGFMPDDESYSTNLKQRFRSLGTLGKDIFQGFSRNVGSVAQTISEALPGGTDELEIPDNKVAKTLASVFFGDEPVTSFSRRIAEGEQVARQMGIPGRQIPRTGPLGQLKDVLSDPALGTSFLVIGGLSALDFTPLGGEKKALEQLAKETSEEGIIRLLKDLKITGKEADDLVPGLRGAKTSVEVKNILDDAAKRLPGSTDEVLEQSGRRELAPERSPEPPVARLAAKDVEKEVSSLADDITQVPKRQVVNVDRFTVSQLGKKVIQSEVELLKPTFERIVGDTLTHKEVAEVAAQSSKVLEGTIGREQTRDWEAAMLNLRSRIATASETGTVTPEFLKDLETLKSQGADIARKLESLKIQASPDARFTPAKVMVQAVLDLGVKADDVLAAAKGVDFNNAQQAAEFYRKFVAPKLSDWVDVIRYNSMLSSPKTHIINIFSNLLNNTVRPVIEKAMLGGMDLLSSKITKENRKRFAGEAGKYALGYLKSFREAVERFGQVWEGSRPMTNLDTRQIPLATQGRAAQIEKVLKVPVRLLESADQFFQVLSEGGEVAALNYRQGKGVNVFNIKEMANDAAQYGIFRQELHPNGQGVLLDAIDTFTSHVEMLRQSKNPIISTIAKFTVPFVRTPMNIFKQGIEYTPGIGFGTMIGAADKAQQFARATIGTGVGILAGTLIAANRLSGAEPTTTAEKNQFRANGMQPYSVKFGDTWYSFQKLPPFMSYPLATVAIVNDLIKSGKLDEDGGSIVLSAFAKYGQFLADQSYFKNIGDAFAAVGGDEYAISRLIGNYPQQLVPFRALSGWFARMADEYQRTIDNKADFVDKQMQLLMMNIPGLSQKLEPRRGPNGRPIENPNRAFNAISPVNTVNQTDRQARAQEAQEREKRRRKKKKEFKSLNTL